MFTRLERGAPHHPFRSQVRGGCCASCALFALRVPAHRRPAAGVAHRNVREIKQSYRNCVYFCLTASAPEGPASIPTSQDWRYIDSLVDRQPSRRYCPKIKGRQRDDELSDQERNPEGCGATKEISMVV